MPVQDSRQAPKVQGSLKQGARFVSEAYESAERALRERLGAVTCE